MSDTPGTSEIPAPPGCVELDGVAWCVQHYGIVDELADYLDEQGEPACNMRDDEGTPCRIVPMFIRAEDEADPQ